MSTVSLSKISLDLYHAAGNTFTIDANIYAVDGDNRPTGPSLGSDSLNELDIDETPGSWVDFTFTPSVELTVGNTYAIVFSLTDPDDDTDITVYYDGTQNKTDVYSKIRLLVGGGSQQWSTDTSGYGIAAKITWEGEIKLDTSDRTGSTYLLCQLDTSGGDLFDTEGGVWFTVTASLSKATNPSPSNGASNVPVGTTQLSWTIGDNATGNDVYFGEAGNMVLVSLDQAGVTHSIINQLSYGTNYEWRIDSRDDDDNVVTGDTWSFSTESFVPPDFTKAGFVQNKIIVASANNKIYYES